MPQCPRCRDVGWVDVNLFGPVLGVRPLLPGMLVSEVAGVIVNVGSKQGIANPPGHPIYKMTKAVKSQPAVMHLDKDDLHRTE